jgi:uncharacterized membrane protein YccC
MTCNYTDVLWAFLLAAVVGLAFAWQLWDVSRYLRVEEELRRLGAAEENEVLEKALGLHRVADRPDLTFDRPTASDREKARLLLETARVAVSRSRPA